MVSNTIKPDWWTSDHWSTPQALVDRLAAEEGLAGFDLDVCARPETAKAPKFYTVEDDGLGQPWYGNVWLNPPFSNVGPWLRRARAEVDAGHARLVVAILPPAVETRWFHRDVLAAGAQVKFLLGRTRWLGWAGTPIPHPKTGSLVAIYRPAPPLAAQGEK